MNKNPIIRGVIAAACFLILPGLVGVALAQTDPTLPDPIIVDPDRAIGNYGGPAFYYAHLSGPSGKGVKETKNPFLPIRPGPAGPIVTNSVDPKAMGTTLRGTTGVDAGGGGLYRPTGMGASHRPDPGPVMRELASVRTALGL